MTVQISRKSALADLLGGLSLAGLMVPEAIAYSAIAGLPAAFGLTAAIIGPLAYALIGRSRLAVVSATSGAAALLAAAISTAAIADIPRIECALALTLLVGIFFLIGAALRISALTSFVSRAVLNGFGLGLAITISLRQLPALLGLKVGGGSPWQIVIAIAAKSSEIHLPSLLVGGAALFFLGISRRFKFAAAGLVLIVAATVVLHFGPADHFGIEVAGPIALEIFVPHIPALSIHDWERLGQLALPIAIVILAESWATIRTLAAAAGEPIDARREIAALGFSNLASALLRGLPVGAGFSIGNANALAGTATRIGAVLAAILVAAVALGASGWIALVPDPVLAAIVIAALSHALSPAPIFALFRLGRDQWIALLSAIGVLVLGIVNGLLLAVVLSVLGLLRRLAYPRVSELGRAGGHDFVDCSMHPEAQEIPGLLVMRPNGPLFFGNAEAVLSAVAKRARETNAHSIVLSLEETDDLDSSAFAAICDLMEAMTAQGRVLILARVHDRVRTVLERGGQSRLAGSATFSVDDAVRKAVVDRPRGLASASPMPQQDF